jgi:hypothetical protein
MTNEIDIIKWMEEDGIDSISIVYMKDGVRVFEAFKNNKVIQRFSYKPHLADLMENQS